MALVKQVHSLIQTLPASEKRNLGSQTARASRSVPTNIVEGYAKRASAKEFKRYLTIAMGSANEMEVHLKVARDLGLASIAECERLVAEYQVVGRQLRRLIQNWRTFEKVQPPASSFQ